MAEEKIWCVYRHTNRANGKVYIGKTCKKPESRWNGGKGYRYNRHFWNSIQKYGWDGFDHEVVATGLDAEEATAMERKLIAEHGSMDPDKGYNQTAGGEGMLGWHHTEQSRAKIIQSNRTRTISEETKRKQSDTHKRLVAETGKVNFKGEHHTEETKRILSEKAKKRPHPPHSAEARAKISAAHKGRKHGPMSEEQKRKISQANMGHPARNLGYITSDGKKMRLSERMAGENNPMYGKVSPRARAVAQYSLDGEYIKTYPSATHANRATGVSNITIGNCCKGTQTQAGGFLWIYADEITTETVKGRIEQATAYEKPASKSGKSRAVSQYSPEGTILAEYPSAAEAARETGANAATIRACCKGTALRAGGFYWSYAGAPFVIPSPGEILDNKAEVRKTKAKTKVQRKTPGELQEAALRKAAAHVASNPDYHRAIEQYSRDGQLLSVYDDAAAVSFEGYDKYSVISVCRGGGLSHKGYLWRFADSEDEIDNAIEEIQYGQSRSGTILRFSLDGDYIESFRSIADAQKKTGISNSCISACCMRKTKTCGNSFFFYERISARRSSTRPWKAS